MLFRLGEGEDAIEAKVHDFQLGGESVLGDLRETWNKRISHESRIIVQGMGDGRKGLAMTLEKLGKDSKGAVHGWARLRRLKDVQKMVAARETEMLGQVGVLNGKVGT